MAIKNYTTKVPAVQTVSEIQGMLATHGARRVMMDMDDGGKVSAVTFAVECFGQMQVFRIGANAEGVMRVMERDHIRCDKELLSRIAYCMSEENCDGCPLNSGSILDPCVDELLKKASDAIEQLARECGAEVSGMCKFRITGFESSESWERYQYSSDAPVDVTVFAKSKKEAIEKAEKIIGCPISTTNRHIVVQEVEHERKNAD